MRGSVIPGEEMATSGALHTRLVLMPLLSISNFFLFIQFLFTYPVSFNLSNFFLLIQFILTYPIYFYMSNFFLLIQYHFNYRISFYLANFLLLFQFLFSSDFIFSFITIHFRRLFISIVINSYFSFHSISWLCLVLFPFPIVQPECLNTTACIVLYQLCIGFFFKSFCHYKN